MTEYRWVLHDLAGDDIRATDPFATKEDAESWMGVEWANMLDEGAESVSLMKEDRLLYRMGLREV